MNNAYQFYSPDPGPASEVWACIEFGPPGEAKEGERKVQPVHRWMKVPKRPQHWRDPLGQTYYRRLALTEQIAAEAIEIPVIAANAAFAATVATPRPP